MPDATHVDKRSIGDDSSCNAAASDEHASCRRLDWVLQQPSVEVGTPLVSVLACARRTISLPLVAVDALKAWRKDQAERRLRLGEEWHDGDVVIDRGDGRPLDPAEFSHAFARLARSIGLEGVRLHDLRHAFATSLLVAGVHPKVVSEALGHASTAFTMDTYQHLLPSMGEQVAEAMQRALG
jgi:integrase